MPWFDILLTLVGFMIGLGALGGLITQLLFKCQSRTEMNGIINLVIMIGVLLGAYLGLNIGLDVLVNTNELM